MHDLGCNKMDAYINPDILQVIFRCGDPETKVNMFASSKLFCHLKADIVTLSQERSSIINTVKRAIYIGYKRVDNVKMYFGIQGIDSIDGEFSTWLLVHKLESASLSTLRAVQGILYDGLRCCKMLVFD